MTAFVLNFKANKRENLETTLGLIVLFLVTLLIGLLG